MNFDNFEVNMTIRPGDQTGCLVCDDLLVSRMGSFLKITNTWHTPSALGRDTTLVAKLIETQSDTKTLLFRLLRILPPKMDIRGCFSPADGYASLSQTNSGLNLRVCGPHFHPVDAYDAAIIAQHIQKPPIVEPGILNWTLAALCPLPHPAAHVALIS